MKKILCAFLITNILSTTLLYSQENKLNSGFKEYALPSDFEGIKKEAGAVYYSSNSKGKALIPVNVWGEVNKAGLHFVPVDTDVVQGLSLAGGPKTSASLDKVKLTRNNDGKLEQLKFNLEEGGDTKAFQTKLNPGDTIFVEKELFYENRSYYTSLIGVCATILSSIILYRQVKRGN